MNSSSPVEESDADMSRKVAAERLRAWSVRRFRWARERIPGVEAVVETLEHERVAGGGLLAGGLAYRFFFWFVPFTLVVTAGLSFWVELDPEGFDRGARELGLGAALAGGAAEAIADGAHGRWYLIVAGSVLMAWFGASAVRALRIAYALAWRQRPARMRRPLAASALFTGVTVTLIALSVATAWAREHLDGFGLALTMLVVVVYAAVALAVMRLLPHGDAPVRALVPGALLVALGVQAMHVFVALYLGPRLGRSSELYGSLGAATTILLGLYFSARMFTFAAFLDSTLWERRGRPARSPDAEGEF